MQQTENTPLLSVVTPLLDEAGNILPLVTEICTALSAYTPLGGRYEIICVDDGSTDETAAEVLAAAAKYPQVRLIKNGARLGMSAAIRNGVRRAKASWVMTIDGDRQNDPADATRLLALGWEKGMDQKLLVAGIRVNRQDTQGKRWASRIANTIRRGLLHDDCPDTGCSLKLFPRDSYLELPFFSGLHRFMPALLRHYGHHCMFVPVNDRLRTVGQSKSDFVGRAVRGFFDLLGVMWLMRRTPEPRRGEEASGRA